MRRLSAVVLVSLASGVLAGVLPAVAVAAGTSSTATATPNISPANNALNSGFGLSPADAAQATQPQTTTVAATTTSSGSGGLSGSGALVIGLVAFGLLAGIVFFVFRDSRRHATARTHSVGAGLPGHTPGGSKAAHKTRKLSAAERKRRKRGRAR
jgi:predicted PurR-regulated permease PerM